MPKNKFNGFYYGIGLQLDEASIDKAGQQLEGRLNKVVDNVTKNLTNISDAVAKGVKNVDTNDLVKSLVEAQRELNQMQQFDPSKLQKQIDVLNSNFTELKGTLGDVATQLESFTNNVTDRLSNIEIKTSKQGKDALKADLKGIIELARGYQDVMAKGVDIDTSALDKYFIKIKQGFKSIQNSGNPMEMFADKELATYFVTLTNIFRQMGGPVDKLRGELFTLSSAFKDAFESSSAAGSKTIFKDIGYQIEATNAKLKKAESQLESYASQISKYERRTKTFGFDIDVDDKNLDFDAKIKKIQQYYDMVDSLDPDSKDVNEREKWVEITRKQIALIQSAEKDLVKLSKKSNGQEYIDKWVNAFGDYDLKDNKHSQTVLGWYIEQAEIDLDRLNKLKTKVEREIAGYKADIGELQAKESVQSSGKKRKTTKNKTQSQSVSSVDALVNAKLKINEAEWRRTINTAISNLESGNKIKPFKIKVEATQGKILNEIKKIKEATLMDKKNNGDKDVVHFNQNFEKFITNLRQRKTELVNELKQNWHSEIKDAFSFKIEVLGLDKKAMTENIAAHILPIVDSINTVIQDKPIIFTSNIDALVEEIKSKLDNIEIGVSPSSLIVNSANLGNTNLLITNAIGGNGNNNNNVPSQSNNIPQTAPLSTNVIDKQSIYNEAVHRIDKMLAEESNPKEALKKVKDGAQKLYKQLMDAEEGTEQYYRAQIMLTTLLSKWRGKIGGKNANEAFKVPGVLGVKGQKKNWETYLIDNGILPDTKNSRLIPNASKLEELYGLTKPKKTNDKSIEAAKRANKTLQGAQAQMADRLEAGKQIIDGYIKLAKWAQALGPIADTADIEIKESDFKDTDTIKRRGNIYTKKDIGTIIPGEKLNIEDLNAFLDEYEHSSDEEDKQLYAFLKNLIDAFKNNRVNLNKTLKELSKTDVVKKYNKVDDEDKLNFLTKDITTSYKRMTSNKGSKVAQQHLNDVFKKYDIDLSALPSAKTYAEQWQIIQSQLIGKEGLDFDNLMSDLGSLKGNVGKTYENFMTLLKVSRSYMLTSNALGEIGQEASDILRGKKEPQDKYRKEWDNNTGRSYYTDEKIGVKNVLIEEGLRQEINKLAVVFIDEFGRAIAGFNAGKNIADDYLSSSSSSYSKIIKFLTNAIEQAAQISVDTHRRGAQGYEGVSTWDPESYTRAHNKNKSNDYQFTTAVTEKSQIQSYINNLSNRIKTFENAQKSLNKESSDINNVIKTLESKDNLTESEITQLKELKEKLELNNSKLAEYTKEISEAQSLLAQRNKELKKADDKKVVYKKGHSDVTYDVANANLPFVKQQTATTKSSLAQLEKDFAFQYAVFGSELTKKELDKVTPSLKVPKFNKEYLDGKIDQVQYVKKIEDAYILLHKAKTEEEKASARADARKIIDATELVKKYQEEEAILTKIVKTQKPKNPITSFANESKNKTASNTASNAPHTPQSFPTDATTNMTGGIINVGGSGVALNIAGSGLATESTVDKIYRLLVAKNNKQYDAEINKLKKIIAIREEEERKATEEAKKKTAEEKKGVAEVKKKTTEEKKGTTEVKKKTVEEKKGTEEVKKKSSEEKKIVEEVKKPQQQTKKLVNTQDGLLGSRDKNLKEFFKDVRKEYQEVENWTRMFREHGFDIKGDKIKQIARGTYQFVSRQSWPGLDTYGHMHPRNSLYSSEDMETILSRKRKNKSYDTDLLITPDYVHKITNLSNVTAEQMQNIYDKFKLISDNAASLTLETQTKMKEAVLRHYGRDIGIKYSKNIIEEDGNLGEIFELGRDIDRKTLDTFFKHLNDKKNPKYIEQLNQDPAYVRLNQPISESQVNKKMLERAYSQSGIPIQDALDNGWDLKLFFEEMCNIVDAINKVQPNIPEKSPLHKIIAEVNKVRNTSMSMDDKAKIMDTLKPELLEFFGYQKNFEPDNRFKDLYDKKGIKYHWESDNTKQYDNDSFDDMSLSQLKSELSRLEGLRDVNNVDPRFATAEKQDVIIGLLKNGIKVSGGKGTTSSKDSKDKKNKIVKMPKTAKADNTIQEVSALSNINKDSSAYQQYSKMQSQYSAAVSGGIAKGKNLTQEDAERIRFLASEVNRLGQQIIRASDSMEQFKKRGGEATQFLAGEFDDLEGKMREIAYNNALSSNMLLGDISYDEVSQKMKYTLTDLEGNVTKVTMAYSDLLGMIATTSDKTTNSASSIYKTIESELKQKIGVQDIVKNNGALANSTQYQAYDTAYNNMLNKQDELRAKGKLATKEEKENLISLTNEVKKTRTEFEKLANASIDFNNKVAVEDRKELGADFNPANLEQEMKQFVLSQGNFTASQKAMIESTWSFKNAQDGATYSVTEGKDKIKAMSVVFDEGTRQIGQYTVETNNYKNGMVKFMDSLKAKWQEVARYLMSFGSIYRVWAVLKQGVQYVREIDSALTELKKVTDETEETYDKFLDTAAKTASKVGSTVKEIISSTADWARLNI